MKCPQFADAAIVSDDPFFAAELSCTLARRGHYLCVLDGPRLSRDDHEAETIRRTNALARVNARCVLLAGLQPGSQAVMSAKLPSDRVQPVSRDQLAMVTAAAGKGHAAKLAWGKDRIGLGLLRAMYAGQLITFENEASPTQPIASKSGHTVVCEAGEPLSEVIAANYAFALGAGLHVIDKTDEVERARLLESFYSIDAPGVIPAAERSRLKRRLRELVGEVSLPEGGSLTFITRELPFGVAFPEQPSTHLFTYPDLGISIINGFAAEQKGERGTNIAVLVDPEKVHAPEIEAATKLLPERRMFVRGYRGQGASVRAISEMVDLFPYDLLIFATHCGDSSGWRWTYRFQDSEGIDRCLVVDIAIGIGRTDDKNLLRVMQFMRFHSLDGVDWNDPVAKAELYVGTAMNDWLEQEKTGSLTPVNKVKIERVLGSAAMAMWDDNYLVIPRTLAAEGSPIIINNACVSWHELAARFMFANARAYIGTLTTVSNLEAEAIVKILLGKSFGKYLPHAIWSAQNTVYGLSSDRRPYVMTGVFTQRLRVTKEDAPNQILKRLRSGQAYWRRRAQEQQADVSLFRNLDELATFYERETIAFQARWSLNG